MTIMLTGTVAGLTYDLNSDNIRLTDWDLSLASISRLSQKVPTQQGVTDLGFDLSPRFVPLEWVITGDNADVLNYRFHRGLFLECFQPRIADPVILRFTLEGGEVRAINVDLDGSLNWRDRVEFTEKVGGIFKASDPRLYDPEQRTEVFSLEGSGGSTSGWEIPWEIPWEIGTDTIDAVVTVDYAGLSRLGAPEFPIITIFGSIDNPVVMNETTGEVLDFSGNGGLSIPTTGDWVKINLNPLPFRDAKTVVDQDGNTVSQFLTSGSDLATFHLAPAGEKLFDGSYCTGENIIRVTGSNVTSETVVVMNYFDRYQAI